MQPIALASTSTTKRKWQMIMPELTEGPENETLTAQSLGLGLGLGTAGLDYKSG